MVPECIGTISIESSDQGFTRHYTVWVNVDDETGKLHSIHYTHQSFQIASSVGPLMWKDCQHHHQKVLFQKAQQYVEAHSYNQDEDDFDVIEPFDAQEHSAYDYRNP